jgi:hypothetical protein
MAFMTHYRGHLHEYSGSFNASMLVEEVTLDQYLAMQYPPLLMEKFLVQAQADRELECRELQEAVLPGDTFWIWRRVEAERQSDAPPYEWSGLAVKRAGKVVRVWIVWEGN